MYKNKNNDSVVRIFRNNLGSQDEQWSLRSLLRKGQ